MKRAIMLIISLLMLSGCVTSSLNYKRSAVLNDRYKHKVSDRNVEIFYNTKVLDNRTVIDAAIKNNARIFMKGLTISYDECCQLRFKREAKHNYKHLGNLKNRSFKEVRFTLPVSDIKRFKLEYSYYPVVEDNFLRTSGDYSRFESDAVNGEIVLFVD